MSLFVVCFLSRRGWCRNSFGNRIEMSPSPWSFVVFCWGSFCRFFILFNPVLSLSLLIRSRSLSLSSPSLSTLSHPSLFPLLCAYLSVCLITMRQVSNALMYYGSNLAILAIWAGVMGSLGYPTCSASSLPPWDTSLVPLPHSLNLPTELACPFVFRPCVLRKEF